MDLETNTESARKLASIQIISKLRHHPNADILFLATIQGWQIVVSVTDDVHEGDKVIYCEIDSNLPGDAEWLPPAVKERLLKQKDQTFYHVKTLKIRKELSQGLIIPTTGLLKYMSEYEVGSEVTNELKIEKYEPPALDEMYRGGNSDIKFPTNLVSKTDETRVQSIPKVLDRLKGSEYYITVKCDGTSGTFLIDPYTHEFLCCSRNLVRKQPKNINSCPYWSLATRYNLQEKLIDKRSEYAIQGEICGPKIQKNLMNLVKAELFVFNVVHIPTRKVLPYEELKQFCLELGLTMVPLVEIGNNFNYTLDELLKKSEGKYKGSKSQREGIVVRSKDQYHSFKVINNKYLLNHGY